MSPFIIVAILVLGLAITAWLVHRSQRLGPRFTIVHPPSDQVVLFTCINGPEQGKSFSLHKSQIIIGRTADCDVVISSDHVSRRHALITCKDEQLVLYDQDSTNGTWVNGQRIVQHILQPNDQIQIGPDVFVPEWPDRMEPAPAPVMIPSPPPTPAVSVYDIDEYELLDTRPGGVATVYRARSRRDGQFVAIKLLHSQDPYIRDKFCKEIEVGKTLKHPHIVRVHGGGRSRSSGRWYMVMEFIEGGTLRDQLAPGQTQPLDFAVEVIGQMCDALAYAHRLGVYHRDIKPENILFTSSQVAKLGDFGIARLAQSVTRTAHGMIVGTPLYMSFEQAKGHSIDQRSDIYSLGVVLYELVTGRPPFIADDPLAVVEMHIKNNPSPPRQLNWSISPQIEQVIMRAMEKDRTRRFQSAEEMARALGYTASMHLGSQEPSAVSFPSPVQTPAPTSSLRLIRPDYSAISLEPGVTPLNRLNVNPNDFEISRQHAQITHQEGYWWLQDLGSSNGTFVNELRVFEPVMLQPGDQVRVGRTVLRVA